MTLFAWGSSLDYLQRSRSHVASLQSSSMSVIALYMSGDSTALPNASSLKDLYKQHVHLWSLVKAVFENGSKKFFLLLFSLFSISPVYSLFVPGLTDVQLHYWSEGKYVEGVKSCAHSSKRNIELCLMWSYLPWLNMGFELSNKYLSISELISENVKTDYKYAILLRSLPSLLL